MKFWAALPCGLGVLVAGCAVLPPPPNRPIWHRIDGAFQARQCVPFARDAAAVLREIGIPAQRVVYKWVLPNNTSGYHAVVLYQLNHREFIVENFQACPKEIFGNNLLAKVQYFDPMAVSVRLEEVLP